MDVVHKEFLIPTNSWPKGKIQRELGRAFLRNSLEALEAVSMAIFTRAYGMTPEEVKAELVDVRNDMENSKCFNPGQDKSGMRD